MSKKITFKEIKKIFEDNDCKLLETEYIGTTTKMRYECKCGNEECKISFNTFKSGCRCIECSGSKKYTLEEVKKYFEDNNCKLLATEYKNAHTKMKYICTCGNEECKISFSKFKSGQRCSECVAKRRVEKKRFKFEEAKQYFLDRNCELFETEYINNITPMRYRCDCGNEKCKITFGNFKRGQRCIECSEKKKYTFEEVYNYFEDHNCKLLAKEYKNCLTPMEYECSCGNKKCKISFNNLRRGERCMECSGNKKHTFEFVYNYFKEHKCLLLETEYKNARTKMRYECDCGNKKCKINFNSFKNGKRCNKCGIEKRSGKNAFNYNHNKTDEEREKGRYIPGYNKWVKDVYKQSNNACQCCGETEEVLCAHHIESYGDNEELRTVVSNGIAFCEEHHIEFHKKYGYGNNTREQLNEFLSSFAEIIKIDDRNR